MDFITKKPDGFSAQIRFDGGATAQHIEARRVLLATGSVDTEPALPDLPDAVRQGLIRYCPICDGYEAAGRRIAVIGYGDHGIAEAIFVARSYSQDVTLLTLNEPMALNPEQRRRLDEHGITVI